MMDETVDCKKCKKPTNWLAVFPKGLCLACHEERYNREVARTGQLPKPNFLKPICKP